LTCLPTHFDQHRLTVEQVSAPGEGPGIAAASIPRANWPTTVLSGDMDLSRPFVTVATGAGTAVGGLAGLGTWLATI